MLRRTLPLVLAAFVIVPALAQDRVVPYFQQSRIAAQAVASRTPYFPERLDWQHKKPEEVGMNAALVNEAVQLAIANDSPGPHDMTQFLTNSFGKEPFFSLIGPVKDRGPASGIITHHGYIVAEWADRLPPITETEAFMLEGVPEPRPTSRLCCQIRMTAELDGLVVHLPEEQV